MLARKDAEWAHSELSRANESSAAFRREKHAETVRLQSELDSAQQAASSATSKLSSLQNAYDTTAARLTESTKKVSELTARLAQQEDSFRQEMATQGRLVNLLERRAEDAQRRIDEVESQWETVLEQCREREEAARAEAAAERDRRERVEMEKEEIQIALDRLAEGVGIESGGLGGQNGDMQVADDSVSGYGGSLPSTPRRGPSVGPIGTPVGMSPTAALASRVQKSGKTFTQVYTELARTQEELRREKVEVNRLGGVLAQVMDELQERAPGLQAQREETERLSIDLAEMSGQLARACEERDAAEQSEKASRLSAESVQRENGILQQQLADLGRQVRALTRELVLRDDPSAAARLADDGSALEEMDGVEGPVQDASDTAAVITAQLVTFRSLSELCSQNARLLRVTRELGARMESEERNYRTRLEANESEAVAEARELIVQLREEVQGERLRSEGVKRERDMFRRMCASGGASGAVPHVGAEDGATGAAAGLAAQYATLQSQFEAYKTETSQDTQRLKDDIQAARNEAGAAAVQAAREKAGREAGEERYRTLQQSYELQRSELAEINKRSQALHDNLARRDIASHAIEEQLLEARSAAERLRNEAANLRAEKELWKVSSPAMRLQ